MGKEIKLKVIKIVKRIYKLKIEYTFSGESGENEGNVSADVMIDLENIEYIQDGREIDNGGRVNERETTVFCMKSGESIWAIDCNFNKFSKIWEDYINQKIGYNPIENNGSNAPKDN